jgi:hypothetical protein
MHPILSFNKVIAPICSSDGKKLLTNRIRNMASLTTSHAAMYSALVDDSVEEWDVWPQGPRLQGEDGGKIRARGSDNTTEQSNNRILTRHRDNIDIHQNRT